MEWNNTLDFNEYERIEDPHEPITAKIIQKIFMPLVILFGLLGNSLFLVQLIRRRLWKSHPGYVSLIVVLVTNLIYIVLVLIPYMLSVMDESLRIQVTSHVGCKCYFLFFEVLYSGPRWSVVVLLISALIHLYIRTPHRMCGCRRVTIIFSTPLGMLIINGVIFLVLFIGGIMFVVINDHGIDHFAGVCHYVEGILGHLFVWSLLTNKLPELLFIPILSIVTTCKLVRQKNRPTAIPADTLDQEEEEDDDDNKTTEFTWTSIGVGLATFVCFLPVTLTAFLWHILMDYDWDKMLNAWLMTTLVSDFYQAIVPVICLAFHRETRQFVKSTFFMNCLTGRRVGIPCFSPIANDTISLVETGQEISG